MKDLNNAVHEVLEALEVSNIVLLVGPAMSGKTTILERLNESDSKFVNVRENMTDLAFIKTLKKNEGNILMIDEADRLIRGISIREKINSMNDKSKVIFVMQKSSYFESLISNLKCSVVSL